MQPDKCDMNATSIVFPHGAPASDCAACANNASDTIATQGLRETHIERQSSNADQQGVFMTSKYRTQLLATSLLVGASFGVANPAFAQVSTSQPTSTTSEVGQTTVPPTTANGETGQRHRRHRLADPQPEPDFRQPGHVDRPGRSAASPVQHRRTDPARSPRCRSQHRLRGQQRQRRAHRSSIFAVSVPRVTSFCWTAIASPPPAWPVASI